MSSRSGHFHCRQYAPSSATQGLPPSSCRLNLDWGVVLSGMRRMGEATTLKQDPIPKLEADTDWIDLQP